MTTLADIEALTANYALARRELGSRVQVLQDELEVVKRRRLDGIRNGVEAVAALHDELKAAIEANPALFDKPRTRVLHGVKVGYIKQRGQVVIKDEAAVIARIRKLLPKDQAELLIRVKESVHKPGVYDLTAADLKRLDIAISADTDAVVIKPTDTEVDKLVNALLAEIERSETEAAA